MMKFLYFLESLFYKKYKQSQSSEQQKDNILKLLQWGNYSEVNNHSLTRFKKR